MLLRENFLQVSEKGTTANYWGKEHKFDFMKFRISVWYIVTFFQSTNTCPVALHARYNWEHHRVTMVYRELVS